MDYSGALKQKSKIRSFALSSIIFVFFLIVLPSICGKNSETSSSWSIQVLLFASFALFCQFYSIRKLKIKTGVLFVVFLILSYVFNLSQVVVLGVVSEVSSSLEWSSVFNNSYVVDATYYALKSILFLFWGGLAYFTFMCKAPMVTDAIQQRPPKKFFLYILLFFGIIFDVINSIAIPIIYGYYDVETTTSRMIIRLFGLVFSSAMVLFLTYPKFTVRERKWFLILFIIYKILCMLTGYRAFALLNIVLAIYVYHKSVNKIRITFRTIVISIISVVIGSAYMVAIRETRMTGVDLSGMVGSGAVGNPVLDLISEFGGTLNVLCRLLQETLGNGIGGGQLMASLLSIIPGAAVVFPDINFSELSLDTALDLRHLGGSYIGDLLFDFGKDGLAISSFVLGWGVAFLFSSFETALAQNRFVYASYLFPIVIDMLFCVRSSLAKLPREIVWLFLILFFFWTLFSGRKRGQKFVLS